MAAQSRQPWESGDALKTSTGNDTERSADDELIARARQGDDSAFGVLYQRHVDSVRGFAQHCAAAPMDVEDVVSEAFTRVLGVIRSGGGPRHSFRMYVLTVVRRVAASNARERKQAVLIPQPEDLAAPIPFEDPVVTQLEGSMVARAFAGLPERWRTVLWHTEVEGENPAHVAPHLGLSANGAAALAYRAREGLRTAYVQEHLSANGVEHECRAFASKLAAYHRNAIGPRARRRIDEHLTDCERCRRLLAELVEVSGSLRGVIGPIILGPAAAAHWALTERGGIDGTAPTDVRPARWTTAGGHPVKATAIVTALVACLAAVALSASSVLRPDHTARPEQAGYSPTAEPPRTTGSASPSRSPSSAAPVPLTPPPAHSTAPPESSASATHRSPTPTAGAVLPPPAPTRAATPDPTSAPTPHPQPVLLDASFEEPSAGPNFTTYRVGQSIGGWQVVQNCVDLVGNWKAADGSQAIDLNGTFGPMSGAIAQTFDTVPGQRYTVTFDLAGNPEGPPAVKTLMVEAGETKQGFSFDITGHSKSAMGWRPETVRFTARANRTTLRFTSTTDTNSYYGPAIDNVNVRAD